MTKKKLKAGRKPLDAEVGTMKLRVNVRVPKSTIALLKDEAKVRLLDLADWVRTKLANPSTK